MEIHAARRRAPQKMLAYMLFHFDQCSMAHPWYNVHSLTVRCRFYAENSLIHLEKRGNGLVYPFA